MIIEPGSLRLIVGNSGHRLELVIRRWTMSFKYASLQSPIWTPFEDSESQSLWQLNCWKRPENRKFEVISEKGAPVGSIVIHTCHPNKSYRASTPWGELEIRKSGLTKYDVLQGSILIGTVKEKLPGRRAIVSFPMSDELRFKGSKLWYSKMNAETEAGSVSIVAESGHRPNLGPKQKTGLKSKDFGMLPEEEKKAVVETDHYMQWRISLSGLLPVRDDDILKVLALNLCRSKLYLEYVGAIA